MGRGCLRETNLTKCNTIYHNQFMSMQRQTLIERAIFFKNSIKGNIFFLIPFTKWNVCLRFMFKQKYGSDYWSTRCLNFSLSISMQFASIENTFCHFKKDAFPSILLTLFHLALLRSLSVTWHSMNGSPDCMGLCGMIPLFNAMPPWMTATFLYTALQIDRL